MAENTYPAEPHRLPQGRLWYGFSAAPAAWAIQGLVGVIVSSQVCPADVSNWGLLGQGGIRLLLGVVTLCALVVAISAGVISFQSWQRLAGGRELIHAPARTREAFMSVGGVLISTVFTLGILWAGIPLIMLQICARAR
jgi:hypothetical protein